MSDFIFLFVTYFVTLFNAIPNFAHPGRYLNVTVQPAELLPAVRLLKICS